MCSLDGDSGTAITRFRLTKSNLIYFGLVVAFYVAVFFLRSSPMTPYESGQFFGTVFGLILLPTLIGWIAFRLFRRSLRAGSIAFNITMTLAIVGQINHNAQEAKQNRIMNSMMAEKEALKSQINNLDDPTQAIDQYTESVRKNFDAMASSGSDVEKQFFRLMKEFMDASLLELNEWNAAIDSVQSPEILDYSRLADDAEFDRQRAVINDYRESAREYGELMSTMRVRMEKKLGSLANHELAKGALSAADKKTMIQSPIITPLVAAHREYGHQMIELLDLLQKDRKAWSLEDGEILIRNEVVREQFNEIITKINELESKINALTLELRKTL